MARVSKVMLAKVPTLKKEAKIEQAARLLQETRKGCIVIVENQMPVGMITDLDIVRHATFRGTSLNEKLSKIMSSPVTFMSPDTKLDEALKVIDTKRFRRYPVVQDNRLVGLVTKNDIVNAISDNMKLHRNIQNFVLVVFVLFEFFVFVLYKYVQNFFGA